MALTVIYLVLGWLWLLFGLGLLWNDQNSLLPYGAFLLAAFDFFRFGSRLWAGRTQRIEPREPPADAPVVAPDLNFTEKKNP